MKKGDLVKFVDHIDDSPRGLVITDPMKAPETKYSGPRATSVRVVWSDKYTPNGFYNTMLLEVVNES
jgi:hypothetical protein